METRRELWGLLGALLEYPAAGLLERARRCQEILARQERPRPSPLPRGQGISLPVGEGEPETARLIDDFAAFLERTSLGRQEELYTSTFDLTPTCYPYVGYQLFGEDPKRAELMVGLRESYRAFGFDAGKELPDHVAVLFAFLARLTRDRSTVAPAPAVETGGADGSPPRPTPASVADRGGRRETAAPAEAAGEEADLERDLLDELLAPALEKMATSLGKDNPYRAVVRCALCVVRERAGP